MALWVIVAVLVLAGIGAAVYFLAVRDGSDTTVEGTGATGGETTEGKTTTESTEETEVARLFPVRAGGSGWGYIDGTGALVIEPQFNTAGPFSEGLAAVEVNGAWGYIDKTGTMVIEPRFGSAAPFSAGVAWVVTEFGKEAYIDTTGTVIWQQE